MHAYQTSTVIFVMRTTFFLNICTRQVWVAQCLTGRLARDQARITLGEGNSVDSCASIYVTVACRRFLCGVDLTCARRWYIPVTVLREFDTAQWCRQEFFQGGGLRQVQGRAPFPGGWINPTNGCLFLWYCVIKYDLFVFPAVSHFVKAGWGLLIGRQLGKC